MTNTIEAQDIDDDGTDRMIAPDLIQTDRFSVDFGGTVLVAAWRGIDGAIVVQVDTEPDAGRVRVVLNDAPIFDADPKTGEHYQTGQQG